MENGMQAARAPIPPRLPGASITKLWMVNTLVFGGLGLMFVLVVVFGAILTTPLHWHLPWPALQWAVTSPLGNLTLLVLCALVYGPMVSLLSVWGWRHSLVQARDVTEVPLAEWVRPHRTRLQPSLGQRWLGVVRRERVVSEVLLALGTLLCLALAGAFFVSIIAYTRPVDSRVCVYPYGCPPPVISLTRVASGTLFVAQSLAMVWQFFWLKRVEASSGVWFRSPEAGKMVPLGYVRQPGVTPEVAASALARFSSTGAVPQARRFFFVVLMLSLYMVLLCATFLLSAWLRNQWLPG